MRLNNMLSITKRAPAILAAIIMAVVLAHGLTGAPSPAHGESYISQPQDRYRVFVFGDKMATGLLAGLWRVLKGKENFVARGRLREGSGLVRSGYYDWPRTIAAVLESKPVDIAIIMLGANDARDMRVRGKTLLFGSDEWRAEYASRVRSLMRMIRSRGVALYWVGLPPVRDDGRNEALKYVNEIIRQAAKAEGVRHIDIYADFATADGRYTESGPDIDGRIQRLRSRNGRNFIKAGNTKLAAIVMRTIEKDVEQAGKEAAGEVVREEESQPEALKKVLFGAEKADGGDLVVALTPMTAAEMKAQASTGGSSGGARTAQLKASPPKGSRAWRLLREGAWTTQPGSVTDFSLPR